MLIRKIFQNEHFIIVDKPGGWLTIPGRFGPEPDRTCLADELTKDLKQKVWVVHRLDREVSGIVLFAKTAEAHKAASEWFENRKIHKFYEAITSGDPTNLKIGQPVEWKSKLLRGKRRAYEAQHGKSAVTHAMFMGVDARSTPPLLKWRVEPITGRGHQIRYELSNHGFPIVGDELYGSTLPFLEETIALRAVEINFTDCPGAKDTFNLPEKITADRLF